VRRFGPNVSCVSPTDVAARPEQRLSTTVVMALAAVGAALVAMFGHKDTFTPLTMVLALAGLVPWALLAGGVHVRLGVFYALVAVPAAVMILVDRNPGGLFPLIIGSVWVTRSTSNRWAIGAVLAIGSALAVAHAMNGGEVQEDGTIYFVAGFGVAWLTGTLMRRQEELLAQVQLANERQAEHAASAERTRIAREVHDVVAHSLTVTMLHVTGARRALSHDPDRAAEALERAETVGRESLDSIRQIVGLLRTGPNDDDPDTPLPDLADVPALVAQFRDAGLDVDAVIEVDGLTVDPTVGLAVFRVVQECLSNVLQHAPGRRASVAVRADHGGAVLRVVAENELVTAPADLHGPARPSVRAGARSGLGLRGMAERVRAAGGTAESGVTDAGTFRVEAVLPLRRASSAVDAAGRADASGASSASGATGVSGATGASGVSDASGAAGAAGAAIPPVVAT
jgi:signal transduction histidine kinase